HEDATLSLADLVQATAAFEGGAPVVEAMQGSAAAMQRAARHPLPAAPAIAAGVAADGFGDRGQGYRQGRVGLELPVWWPQQRTGRRAIAAAAAQEAVGA